MRTVWLDEDGAWRTTLRGRQVLAEPRINKGTAFSDNERRELGVTGLIPPAHVTLDDQVARVYAQYLRQPTDLARNVLLTEVHDRNEVLFYRLLTGHLTEMLPIVYTPTVGQAIEAYSHEYRRPRGVYLSVDHPELIETSLLRHRPGAGRRRPDRGHRRRGHPRHRGLGRRRDPHRGGQARRVHRGGRHRPDRALPVMLDVGTDRQSLLDDPLYIGNRHPRVPPPTTTRSSTRSSPRSGGCSRGRCCTGRTSGSATPGGCSSATGTAADLQRRHPGHRGGQPGRRARRGQGDRHRCPTTGS